MTAKKSEVTGGKDRSDGGHKKASILGHRCARQSWQVSVSSVKTLAGRFGVFVGIPFQSRSRRARYSLQYLYLYLYPGFVSTGRSVEHTANL